MLLRAANQQRYAEVHDPEIAARIASYELAFRMQTAAPELIDLSSESKATLDAYGVESSGTEETSKGAANREIRTRVSLATVCWLGAWSNAACDSSTSSTHRGTITAISRPNCLTTPAASINRSRL